MRRAGDTPWIRWLAVSACWAAIECVGARKAEAACHARERPALGHFEFLDAGSFYRLGRADVQDDPPLFVPVPCHGETPGAPVRVTLPDVGLLLVSDLVPLPSSHSRIDILSPLPHAERLSEPLDRPPR